MSEFRGKLNGFQRMMLHWEDLHPYNAVHAVEIGQPIPLERANAAVQETLISLGVCAVEFDSAYRRYEIHREAPPPEFKYIPSSDNPEAALSREFTDQLNRPFPPGLHSPFRFFHLDSGRDGFFLGLAYHHALCDAASISALMKRIVAQLLAPGAPPPAPMTLYPPTIGRAFPGELSWTRFPALFSGILSDFFGYRKCHIPSYGDETDNRVAFGVYGRDLPTSALLSFAHRHGATVQDAVFAAMLEGFGRLFPEAARPHKKRKHLAVATVIDLRRHAGEKLDDCLGQFLGSYSVKHPVPERTPFSRLIEDLRAQTKRIKHRRTYFTHALTFPLMSLIWPMLPMGWKTRFARNLFPLTGAVSNMDLSDRFARAGVRDYLRAASTGPIMPMLLDITTVGEVFNLTAIYRAGSYSPEQMDSFMGHVRKRLTGEIAGELKE